MQLLRAIGRSATMTRSNLILIARFILKAVPVLGALAVVVFGVGVMLPGITLAISGKSEPALSSFGSNPSASLRVSPLRASITYRKGDK